MHPIFLSVMLHVHLPMMQRHHTLTAAKSDMVAFHLSHILLDGIDNQDPKHPLFDLTAYIDTLSFIGIF